MGPRLTQAQREQITAALFRQEPYPEICAKFNISDRNLRRIAHCLRTYGTTMPPKQEPAKPMGRPRKMNDEMVEELRRYVETHPLAGLKDIQAHLQSKFQFDTGRALISRRLREMGYSLSIISRGVTSVEKDNLPLLTREDTQRLLMDPSSNGIIRTGSGSVYAWLRTSVPVPRRAPTKKTQQAVATPAAAATPAPAPATTEQGQDLPLNHASFAPEGTEQAQGQSQGQTPAPTESPSVIDSGESTPAAAQQV
ncbi:hypothetical protein VTN77DRAFT_3440 [Rasamsonia byssochlamydoides]|uniref:uncharacterized protein n=1 Tax=Rasamsonia byssochlamydoides TaxID=89139 RepID=UPI0037433C39